MKTKEVKISYSPSTVKKALSILCALGKEKDGLELPHLAKKLNLNRSTAYRLLTALIEDGFVKKDPDHQQKYCLGLKVIELAGEILSKMEIREVARPFLRELLEICRETVHLGILDKGEVIFIDKIEGPDIVRLFTYPGKRFPGYVTSIGKAIMAYLSDGELEKVLALQSFQAHTPNTITGKQAFKKHLKQIRRRGYAIDNEENRLTVCCVGVPVFDSNGRALAAISISGPSFRLNLKKLRDLAGPLKSTAIKISKELGYPGDTIPAERR